MPRKKKKRDDIGGSWMDTYADTITLLLTFFILLYSISAVDSQKLNELSEALKYSLQGTQEIQDLEAIDELKVETENTTDETTEYEDLSKKLNQVIEANGLTEVIKIREEDRGIILQLDESILFDPAKANLKSDSKETLDIIATIINDTDNDILVEGHTDNVPMNNWEFKSNWELSTARGVSVVRHLVEVEGLDPTRFAVKGYGEHNPLVPNDTPENKSINRRVDILVVEEKIKK